MLRATLRSAGHYRTVEVEGALTISTVFRRFFAPPSDCASLGFRFSLPLSSPSDRSAMGASREPSSDLTLVLDDGRPFGGAETDRAGKGSVAVESAAETDAEGARMLIFFDLGFFAEGLLSSATWPLET